MCLGLEVEFCTVILATGGVNYSSHRCSSDQEPSTYAMHVEGMALHGCSGLLLQHPFDILLDGS
jgi:hypothetical protein